MKPIIMSAESVRAILAGRKTMTRRPVKPQRPVEYEYKHYADDLLEHCPYPIGSRLWVRETWCPYADDMTREYCQTHDPEWGEPIKPAVYSADYEKGCPPLDVGGCEKWLSPVTMPRWASRITLEVTGVRAERLQEITEADVDAEGFNGDFPGRAFPSVFTGDWDYYGQFSMPECYGILWDSINGKRYPWDSNPWVWVVEFRRIQ